MTPTWGQPTPRINERAGVVRLFLIHPASALTLRCMTELALMVKAPITPPSGNGPQSPKPPAASAQMKPPAPPKLTKQPGENAEQAVMRHVQDHDNHLSHLENERGMHVPRGTASIMMGLPGSGKSHYLNNHHLSHGVHMHVDVDALKPLATGEHDFKYPSHYPDSHPTHAGQPHPQAGQQIHEPYDESNPTHVVAAHPVSKRLEQTMFHEASKRRIPLALDTTGGNHQKWGERIDHLKQEKGYHHVSLVNVKVSKETSMARNAGRKRTVPQSVVDATYAEHDPHAPGNNGKTPFQHLSAKVDKVHVADHETEAGKAGRAATGWHNFLNATKGMAKAVEEALNPFMQMALRARKSRYY